MSGVGVELNTASSGGSGEAVLFVVAAQFNWHYLMIGVRIMLR